MEWLSYTIQKPGKNITKKTLEWNPASKKKKDRPGEI